MQLNRLGVLRPFALAIVALSLLGGCEHRAAAPSREETRAELATHRKVELDRLHTYAEAGVFPRNPAALPQPVHMFRDAEGRLCAVANLVDKDGLHDVVDRMAREHNDVTVADEPSGPLYEWVLASGLTQEEVRRIQGAGFPGEGLIAVDTVEQNRVQMQARLREVERELIANTDASLEVAVARRLEHPAEPGVAVASR